MLTKALKALGSNPPDIKGPGTGYDSIGWVLDVKKLSVPELDNLMASNWSSFDSDLLRDRLFLDGYKDRHEVFRMDLPTWGGEGVDVKVTGKGRLRFRQQSGGAQGYQEIDYRWNGKTFEEVSGKPGDQDARIVRSAIDDALNGICSYGIRGHHAVDHDLIKNALNRANTTAQELFKNGDAYAAADRLRIMFELTSDLVREASTGVPVASDVDDSKDDVQKWIQAWTYNGTQCSVNLTAREWEPFIYSYGNFRQRAGDSARARKVLEGVRIPGLDHAVGILH